LLKIGALVNLYFLGQTFTPTLVSTDPHILIPAQVFYVVSAYRCLFPVRYKNNIVFHDFILSSIFFTCLLATFSEVALIYIHAYVIRLLNIASVGWINILSLAMVVQVVTSQFFVWGAILTGKFKLNYYEELCWGLIYAANTIASVYLFTTVDNFGGSELLIRLNLIFGAVYLPWQLIRLRILRSNALPEENEEGLQTKLTWNLLRNGLDKSIHEKNQTSKSQAWGGLLGIIWMTAYWAAIIPLWVYQIVRVVSR